MFDTGNIWPPGIAGLFASSCTSWPDFRSTLARTAKCTLRFSRNPPPGAEIVTELSVFQFLW